MRVARSETDLVRPPELINVLLVDCAPDMSMEPTVAFIP